MIPLRAFLLAVGMVGLASAPAAAEDSTACERFTWSVARERAAFTATNLPSTPSGGSLPDGKVATLLTLMPSAELSLPVPSERAARPDTFGGFVTIATPIEAGTYQVTVSEDAWIDASQNGQTTLKPVAISGKAGCPEVHKSVRFALGTASVTIQVSRVTTARIKLGFLRAD